MKCYYDILGVEQNAAPDIIKKAYYKQSLKWHPDKNPHNISEATEVFKELQKAYKVLSDIHERSWYDKNRERFMTMTFNSEDELYDLIHSTVFCGFNNDDMGFYNVYGHVFHVLAEREKEAARISGEPTEKIPKFGDHDSTYEDCVGQFYGFWEGLKTRMTFHWKNKHDIDLSIPRDIRRGMEKENAEERNVARKLYNKEIQNFVEGVKSKDPRVKLWREYLKGVAKENEQKAINMRHKAWERSRKQAASTQPCKVYGEISVDELEKTLHNLELEHGKLGGEKEGDSEDLHCIACNKYFRSMAAFGNHERSKNHMKNLAALRAQMMQEDEEFFAEVVAEESEIEESESEEVIESKDTVSTKEKDEIEGRDTVSVKEEDDVEGRCKEEEEEMEEQEDGGENSQNKVDEVTVADTQKISSVDDAENEADSALKADKKRRRRPKEERSGAKVDLPKKTTEDESLTCEHCHHEFGTRNKLFQHIKATGHASTKSAEPRGKLKSKKK